MGAKRREKDVEKAAEDCDKMSASSDGGGLLRTHSVSAERLHYEPLRAERESAAPDGGYGQADLMEIPSLSFLLSSGIP